MTSFVTTLVKVEAEPGIEPGLADLQSVTIIN
jgi:hypothetical protein